MRDVTRWIAIAALAVSATAATPTAESAPPPQLTAEQIVARNVAARGGLAAWRKIQTMIWVGHMDRAGAPMPSMPFVLEQKRPNKTRFEVSGPARSLRVFDGARGWKVRPSSDGSPQVEPYTPQELSFAKGEPVIDGPLIDYQAKGIAVTLEGVEKVEGRKAYRLGVKLASGERNDVWIDAHTFLDIKYERTSYSSHGTSGKVAVWYRDYKPIGGLQIPSVLEIGGGSGKVPDKMVIEKIGLNAPVDDNAFARPGGPSRRHMVTIEAPSPATPPDAVPPAPSPAAESGPR